MQVLICDDDIICAKTCKKRVEDLAHKYEIDVSVQIAESGNQLLFYADTKFANLDLIYLDNHMPGLSGMKTAQALRNKNIPADIVFYTMDETQAIDAFDVDALHYILKDRTNDEKFEKIFLKAAKRCAKRRVEILALSCAGEHRNIPIQDIQYFAVRKRIVTVYYEGTKGNDSFEFYSSLSKIEEFLFGKGFVRIHSSYLVAKKFIHKKTTHQIEMATGEVLPIGRAYAANV